MVAVVGFIIPPSSITSNQILLSSPLTCPSSQQSATQGCICSVMGEATECGPRHQGCLFYSLLSPPCHILVGTEALSVACGMDHT